MSTISLKCPNCGGELLFDPNTQQYKCEYCNSVFAISDIEEQKTGEQEKEEQKAGEQKSEERAMLYSCPNCGAQIVTDETTAATFCYYCHNPVILSGQVTGTFKPDKVIPFAIDRKQAEEHFLDFVQKKKFVPNSFFNKKQIEKLCGVYFPYWVYDGEMDARLEAEGSKIRVWRAGDIEYTETRIFRLVREGLVSIRDITKNAHQKSDILLAEGVLPYDFSKAEEFRMGYLSGFFAEKRDIEKQELEPEVHREVERYSRDLLEDTIHGYTNVHTTDSAVHREKEHWSYMLLPVWTVTYQGSNGKTYYYSMNGQNGKTFGELPVDWKKLILYGAVIGILVFVLCLIGGYFL
jgi:DNA-directed RNA polymerase subunit RPC12/RpoP